MLKVEEWAEIRRLRFSEQMGIKAIARQLGVSKNTVRGAIRSAMPPRYERAKVPSVVNPFEDRIRELLKGCPTMPATVVAERIDWQRGITVLRERVAELRPAYLPADPYQRTDYAPGELAQWDLWQPAVDIPVGFDQTARLWVIVGVTGYARFTVGHMIPSRETEDVLGGHLACLVDLGAVPRLGVYDNEGAIGRNRGGTQELTAAFQAFRGVLGMGAHVLKGGFPEGKGLVERTNDYLETSFLPGRTFTGVADFNAQLKDWLATKANRRLHAAIRCRPADRIAEDRAAMAKLPPVLPDVAWHAAVRLGRDHYVRYATCDYSVHPRAIGRRIQVRADLDWVVATLDGEEVARHRRSLVPHRTLTDPAHGRARRQLREQQESTPMAPADVEVEQRDLAVYDEVLGVAS